MHAAPPVAPACVVCGLTDARALTTTALADGRTVPVCGSHELAHRRATRTAESTAELVALASERRKRHRRVLARDELARLLTEAFASSRRSPRGERRRTGS